MKYSILIIAIDCHFSHMARFVSNLKLANPEVEIHFFTNKKKEDIPVEISDNVFEIIHQNRNNGRGGYLGVLRKIVSLKRQFKKLSKKYKYDIIDIQYPHYYMAFIMRYLKKMSNNIVVTPWGSDILRVDGLRYKVLMNGVLDKCNYITTAEENNIRKRILDTLPNSGFRFVPAGWGSETIDYIVHHLGEIDTQTAKKQFGLSDKFVITCGYNAFRAQNHDKIIEAIARIRPQLPDNLMLLFPVSYGAGDKKQYVSELRELCKEKNLDATFVEDYMSVENVFYLRMATDLFVHVQNTDAGCATIQEYLMCDKKVVHGSWIHYKMLEAYLPLCYYPAVDFSVLGDAIMKAYQSEGIKVAPEVLDYIRGNGWEVKRKGWNDFFSSIVSKA